MRLEPTRSEARLWTWLRRRRFSGHKFRRQHPLGRYVLDFYCAELKLALEIDGRHHETEWMGEYDDERTRFLRRRGIEVIRIANELLARDPELVAECIEAAIQSRKARPLTRRFAPPSPR